MDRNTQSESLPGCKAIFYHLDGATVRFGLLPGGDTAGGKAAIPELAFPLDLDLEDGLRQQAREGFALRAPRVEHRFVTRPSQAGWLYYLVEETDTAPAADQVLHWAPLPHWLSRLGQEDRKALVATVKFLQER